MSAGRAGAAWGRFRGNPLAMLGLVLVAGLLLTAVLAPWLAPRDPGVPDLEHTLAGPSAQHWLGTDELGRDVLSRVVYGSRIAVVVGLASMALAIFVGVVLGALAGYFGRVWDTVIMRTADMVLAFPLTLGAVVLILVAGRGVGSVVLALGLFTWAVPARLLRASILSVREAEYVDAARALGTGWFRILTRHVLPNCLGPVLVYAAVAVGAAVVAEASLSFLGAGVKPDVAEWGGMIATGRQYFGYRNHLWLFPSMAVGLTVLGFVLLGDGLRDALDPRLR